MKNVYVRDKKEAQNDVEVQKVIKEVEDKLGDEGRVHCSVNQELKPVVTCYG
mgnify:CR=1 FL=1